MSKAVVLSGVQPSGMLMLGNLVGALNNWVSMQQSHDCLYCIVDLHALTVLPDADELRERTTQVAAMYLAAGIDPDACTVFIQSQVPQHAELNWILSCYSTVGELQRMTQFKDKSRRQKEMRSGVLMYPVLMAADILLYNADAVPVGEDQRQHLELARNLAQRFNHYHATPSEPYFKIPEPFIPKVGARIMSLSDPTSKMSKSDTDSNASVFLSDSDSVILKKFKRAVTDSETEIRFDREAKPGVSNLLEIQSVLTGRSIAELEESYRDKLYGHLKVETAEVVIEVIRPLRERYDAYLADRGELLRILAIGRDKATARASAVMDEVKRRVGLIAAG